MGVKHLWTVLTPFCDRKPLYELQGKTVAVDLSCWICEAQNIAEYQVQPRMYLRNLYFRTCYLLLMDVHPVFVLEGKAPELKFDTISARNAIQFKGAKPKTDGVKTGKDRTRFHFVLRQCEEMLGCMGIACIKGNGEAESLCAYLNEDGLVDGCISQDSDCFAYGAQVVYRNFSISTQGTQSASGGSVDVYDIRRVNQSLNFGRNKIIAMALLIGSDYSEGVHGVGKDSVLKFFETISNEEVLDRLRSWRKNDIYQSYENQLNDKNICTSCGHSGRIQSHTKNGCNSCNTTKGCDPLRYKDERLKIKNEVNMRSKAIQDPNFPDETLIKEFLNRKDNVKQLELAWKQPNIVKFIKFTTKFLQWEELYSFEKILPVLTRWQCRNSDLLKDEAKLKGFLKPEKIKKARNPKGIPSYEIIWSDPSGCFTGLIPETQIVEHKVDMEKLWSTIEPQSLVENAYPELVEAFKLSKIKPKKASKRKKKSKDGLSEELETISISETKKKRTKKSRAPKCEKATNKDIDALDTSLNLLTIDELQTKGRNIESEINNKANKTSTKTLDSFIKKAAINSYNKKNSEQVSMLENKSADVNKKFSTPIKSNKTDLSFDLDMSSLVDESDSDLSNIIDDIVSKKTLGYDLKKIAEDYVEKHQVIFLSDSSEPEIDVKDGISFFIKNPADADDQFEKTFNATFKDFDSGSDTEEYDFDDKENLLKTNEEQALVKHKESSSSDDDSFCVKNYVPLYERLQAK